MPWRLGIRGILPPQRPDLRLAWAPAHERRGRWRLVKRDRLPTVGGALMVGWRLQWRWRMLPLKGQLDTWYLPEPVH